MIELRNQSQGEEIDYTFVMDNFKGYSSPRAKLTRHLRQGDLIRVKKGLYIFGPQYRKNPYVPELMANKIYGPSYVSREYALAFYGLIPEYVTEITSVSTKRHRHFDTPIGRFSYSHLPLALYQVGYTLIPFRDNITVLFATPEKALADLLYLRSDRPETHQELMDLLFEDLRLNEGAVAKMRITLFTKILQVGGSSTLKLIIESLRSHK